MKKRGTDIFVSPDSDAHTGFRGVLVVDDDEQLGRMLCKSITTEHKNALTFCCYDPHEGLGLVEKLYFDVLICDIHMPGLFGDKIIQHMKKTSPTTYTIAITGMNMDAAFLAGKCLPDSFIDKNKGYEGLMKAVAEGLETTSTRQKNILSKYFSPETNNYNFNNLHWREKEVIQQKLGFKPRDFLLSKKTLNGVGLTKIDKFLSKEEIAFISGFSSFQKLQQKIESLDLPIEFLKYL